MVHGAWYVEPSFIKQAGHAGRSWGCPAVPSNLTESIINTIKDKDNKSLLKKNEILNDQLEDIKKEILKMKNKK